MRVLFLPLYPESMPSSRLRVYQYLPRLKRLGIEGTVRPALPEPWFSRLYYSPSKFVHLLQYAIEVFQNLVRLHEGRRYDLVFIQKGLLCTNFRGFDALATRAHERLVFDLDDAIYGKSLAEFSFPLLRALQDREQAGKISRHSKVVVAGNAYLRDMALRYNPNVRVIPTPVDTDRFRPSANGRRSEKKEIVIGWIGIWGTVQWVRPLEPVFRELSGRYPVRVKFVTRRGEGSFDWPGTRFDLAPWSYETEVHQMEEFDIGVMPLPETEWSKGKCSLKLLQYMAMGIPSVAQRIGMNSEVIEDGVDGFLASSEEEWTQKLSRLIEDASLRKKMGERARAKVMDRYSLEKTTPMLADVLQEAARG